MQNALPMVSVIVPTLNRPEALRSCLTALAESDYPRDCFEVFVVDDGGTASLRPSVAGMDRHMCLKVLRRCRSGGPGAARNTAAGYARGTLFAFTADDCAVSPDWLRTLAACFAQTPDRLIGGRVINALPHNPCSTASDLLIRYLYAHYNRDPDAARFFTPNNMAVPADAFRRVGGFDDSIGVAGEDRDLCDRWLRTGYGMRYVPEAVVHHHHALALGSFWRQQVIYGRGSQRFHQRRAARAEASSRPATHEPWLFYLNLVRFAFVHSHRHAWRHAALLSLSQVANAAGRVQEVCRASTSRFETGTRP